jgi:putative transposase
MPRKKLIRSDRFPYHVTARMNNKEPFPLALKFAWEIATEELYLLGLLYQIEVHAFVLMPNHIHLLLSVPNEDLGKIMNCFISSFTRRVNVLSGRSGHLFGAPYFWSIITSTRYYGHVLKYIYRNPVRGGLCNRVEEYEFSTASGTFGQTHLPLAIHFTKLALEINLPDPGEPHAWIEWLNRPFPIEAEKLIQKILRKKEIKRLLRRGSRLPHDELNCLL